MTVGFRRKRNRLPLGMYSQNRAYLLTLRCAAGARALEEHAFTRQCIDALRRYSEKHRLGIMAYCFMPDHLHLLLQGRPGASVPDFVKEFKQRAGYDYRQAHGRQLWQKSYHDHILRGEEDVERVARYVIGNPVRAGLVRHAEDYPYSGSFVWGQAIMEA